MKTAGILGGFGPESTAKFQLEIVDIFREKKIRTRPSMLIWNTPIPLEIEKGLIRKSERIKEFLPFIIEGAERLHKAEADFLVIPCNTLHILVDELQSLVRLPIVSIIEETANSLSESGTKSIGIIGTRLIVKSNLHQDKLQSRGIQSILPSNVDQDVINQCINLILTNKNTPWVKQSLLNIIKKFQSKNVGDILLACTDLKPFILNTSGIRLHDTVRILAKATVNKMINERR